MKNDSSELLQRTLSNSPVWPVVSAPAPNARGHRIPGFQEVWYLKLNDPTQQKALELRFSILSSENGFKRIAEVWGVLFSRDENKEVSKTAIKQTLDLKAFQLLPDGKGFRIGECEFTESATRGVIQSKGRSLQWDLRFQPAQESRFSLLPEALEKLRLSQSRMATLFEDLRFEGTCALDGKEHAWSSAPGMQGHFSGFRNAHSWTWGHCNSFINEQGRSVPMVFEGLSFRPHAWNQIATPKLSSFYFLYQGQEFRFNSLWDSLRNRSKNSLTEWTFQADRGDMSFRGHATAEHRDFAGVTIEDTDGSLIYCNDSKLSSMTLLIYRRGKLETTLRSHGTTSFEVAMRTKNPYVPLIF